MRKISRHQGGQWAEAVNEDSPKLRVDRGFRDRLSYEGDGDTQEGVLNAPRAAREKWGRTLF